MSHLLGAVARSNNVARSNTVGKDVCMDTKWKPFTWIDLAVIVGHKLCKLGVLILFAHSFTQKIKE